ncbi:hypothetical protein llap_19002 [Limosa lapponica baueri]|uniref:Myotubularin phosphatase domain-containing protein n=1 Tax=Limosa lapponica baueri TaxID=1758121 RepID=A0A2I0TA72_LIMLA|nr:hypothetical protein llap_19002 [Limosa lapponica baueri]
MANRAAGKGYENEDNYDNIRFKFIGIENIHVMRSSLQKLLEDENNSSRGGRCLIVLREINPPPCCFLGLESQDQELGFDQLDLP